MDMAAKNEVAGGSIFYSHLAKVIEGVPARMSNLGGDQWAAWLAGNAAKLGIKQAEIEWSGVNEWLGMQAGKVSKEMVAEYLEGNGVRVEETVLGGAASSEGVYPIGTAPTWSIVDSDGEEVESGWVSSADVSSVLQGYKEDTDQYPDAYAWHVAAPDNERGALSRIADTKYENYTLGGGENYREVLLTLPVQLKSGWVIRQNQEKLSNGGNSYELIGPDEKVKTSSKTYELAENSYFNHYGDKPYRSSHWDQANVLAHIRVNDRVDADGKKVFFVEELQSDWGQQRKKDGFKFTDADQSRLHEIEKQLTLARADGQYHVTSLNSASGTPEFWVTKGEGRDAVYTQPFTAEEIAKAKVNELNRETATTNTKALFEERDVLGNKKATGLGVPSGPFVGSTPGWLALAVKRVIKMAVDGGYDRVAFISGEQSAERYSLNKQVDKVVVVPRTNMETNEKTRSVSIAFKDSGYLDIGIDTNGVINNSRTNSATLGDLKGKSLENVIGKDLAKTIMATERGTFEGDDLNIGGEGMNAFYDQIVPSVVKDVIKKLGGEGMEPVNLGGKAVLPKGWSIQKEYGEYHAYDEHGQSQFIGHSEQFVLDSVGDTGSLGEQVGFTITEKMREIVKSVGVPLFQDSRGTFEASTLTVTLLDSADESTFIHEAGHFYLEVLADVAGQPGAPLAIGQDVEAVMEWLGVPGGLEGWKRFSMEEKRPFHEQFARGVEAYFMTGVAPAPELEGMFSRFAKFLAGVYKSVAGLDVALTPKLVSVFDRLVAGSSLEDRAGVDVVQEGLAAQLDAIDRFPGEVNRAYAGMVANFYGAVAGAAELSVADLAAKYPLQIRSDVHGLVPGGVEKARTGSAEFKEWFGKSAVVDAEGAPLVVYHGTRRDFDAFDANAPTANSWLLGNDNKNGFFFTVNAGQKSDWGSWSGAAGYSGTKQVEGETIAAPGSNVIPAHLSLKCPLLMTADRYREAGGREDFKEELEALGYDGVQIDNGTYIAFSADQIKSVFNRGSWDRGDPAILHQSACVAEPSVLRCADGRGQSSRIVRDGSYSGQILNVSANGVVTQKINRAGDSVRHDLYALSKPVSVGSVVDIAYSKGVGVVGGGGGSVGVGR